MWKHMINTHRIQIMLRKNNLYALKYIFHIFRCINKFQSQAKKVLFRITFKVMDLSILDLQKQSKPNFFQLPFILNR